MSEATHTKDSDCTVDPATFCCVECGVGHGSPCQGCGGTGFHAEGCHDCDENGPLHMTGQYCECEECEEDAFFACHPAD